VSGLVEGVATEAAQEEAQFGSVGLVGCVDEVCEIAAGGEIVAEVGEVLVVKHVVEAGRQVVQLWSTW